MNKSIWAIEQGEYSDYRVVAVFSSEENAKKVIERITGDEPTIVEWPLDPGVAEMNKGYNVYNVIMLKDGTTERIDKVDDVGFVSAFNIIRRSKMNYYEERNIPDCLSCHLWARDEKHAVKIANEKRAQMIANGEWNAD